MQKAHTEAALAEGLAQASPTKPSSPSGAQRVASAETSRVSISDADVKNNFSSDHPLYSLLNPRDIKEQKDVLQAISNVLRQNKSEDYVLSFSYSSQATTMRVQVGVRPSKLSTKKLPTLQGGVAEYLAVMKLATLETEIVSKEDSTLYNLGNRSSVRYYFVFNGPPTIPSKLQLC